MGAHWKSEDGKTEIWLSDIGEDGGAYLTVNLPDGPMHPCMGDTFERHQYLIDMTSRLQALIETVFGADKPIREIPLWVNLEKIDSGIIHGVRGVWDIPNRQVNFRFVGIVSPAFKSEQLMLEG